MEALRKEEICTIEDIYTLPEGERAELIDGRIYYMVPPSTRHQRILNYISTEINLYIRNNNGAYEVFPAPFAVFLDKDDKNYVEPDISVICDKDKITEKGCYGAPDWIVDPIKNQILVYGYEQKTMEQYSFGDDVPVGIYKGFSIKLQ